MSLCTKRPKKNVCFLDWLIIMTIMMVIIQLIHLNAGSKKNVKIHLFIIEF